MNNAAVRASPPAGAAGASLRHTLVAFLTIAANRLLAAYTCGGSAMIFLPRSAWRTGCDMGVEQGGEE